MRKTLGNVVDPLDAAHRLSVDPLRLFLVKEVTYGGDGDFSWHRLQERYNADLANNLGNLVSRVAAMADKYRRGVLKPVGAPGRLAEVAARALGDYRPHMDALALEKGTADAFRIVDAANEYIAETQPWALERDERQADRLSQVLFDVAEALRVASIMLLPVIPRSAAEILRRVGDGASDTALTLDAARWRNEGERTIVKGDALWPRAVLNETGATGGSPSRADLGPTDAKRDRRPRVDETKSTPPAAAPAQPPAAVPSAAPASDPNAGRITIDDFMKVDLRVAKVLAAEKVPNSRKLMKLQIDVGTEQRTLVAGIAEAYEPEQLVGRTVGIVFNLKPAKLMGIESNGMILAASPEGGKPTLVSFDGDIPPGSRIR
jgi:methionyl-tRNA synthetase